MYMPLPSIFIVILWLLFELLRFAPICHLLLLNRGRGRVRAGNVDPEHALVVDEDLGGEAFDDPRVQERLEGGDALFGVPLQTLLDKVEEAP